MFIPIMRMPGLVSASPPPPPPPPGDITFTYEGFADNGAGAGGTKTYADQPIGDAAADRLVFAAVHWRNSAAASVSGVTIGGIAATRVAVSGGDSGPRTGPEFWWANVPTGTTADIVVTFDNNFSNGVDIYAVYGADTATPVRDHAEAGATDVDTLSGALDVVAGDLVLAAADNESDKTVAWVGVDEDSDRVISATQLAASAASRPMASDDATYAIEADFSSSAHHNGLAAVAIRPAGA